MRAALGRSVARLSGIGRGRCTTRCLLTHWSDQLAASSHRKSELGLGRGTRTRRREPRQRPWRGRTSRDLDHRLSQRSVAHRPRGMNKQLDVIVIGGGYAGVMTANRLTERPDVAVTLINPRPTFVERIRLHQMVAGSDDAVVDYGQVLADRVRLVVDAAVRIDAAGRRVALASGDTLDYDYLVYAVGSHSAAALPPGAAEHAYPIASLEEAQRLRPALDAAPVAAAVTVVGAGPTGIETAAELAETGRAVTLVCGDVL